MNANFSQVETQRTTNFFARRPLLPPYCGEFFVPLSCYTTLIHRLLIMSTALPLLSASYLPWLLFTLTIISFISLFYFGQQPDRLLLFTKKAFLRFASPDPFPNQSHTQDICFSFFSLFSYPSSFFTTTRFLFGLILFFNDSSPKGSKRSGGGLRYGEPA